MGAALPTDVRTHLSPFATLVTAAVAALVPNAQAASGRGVVEAIPPEVNDALFVDSLERLDPAVTAMSELFGAEFAFSFLESAALPNLAMGAISSPVEHDSGLDPRGGLGLFRLPDFAGAVGLVAVSDEALATSRLLERLRRSGAELISSGAGLVELERTDGTRVGVLVRDGYLYLMMSEGPLAPVRQAADVILAAPRTGLAGTRLWHELATRIDRRGAVVFFRREPVTGSRTLAAVAIALRAEQWGVAIEGFVSSTRPLGPPAPADAQRMLLRHVSGDPALVLSIWFSTELTRELVLGTPGSLRRYATIARAADVEAEADELARVVGGRVDTLAYPGGLADDGEEWLGPGAVLIETSTNGQGGPRPSMAEAGTPDRVMRGWSALPSELGLEGAPWELRLGPVAARFTIGVPPAGAPRDLLADLQARFGGGAFGPGHATLLVDFAAVRDALATVGLEPPGMLPRAQHLFIDVAAVQGGAQVTGELRYQNGAKRGALDGR